MTATALAGSGGANDVHKMDDFDIKILQQKRHEAEVKRYVWLALWFVVEIIWCAVIGCWNSCAMFSLVVENVTSALWLVVESHRVNCDWLLSLSSQTSFCYWWFKHVYRSIYCLSHGNLEKWQLMRLSLALWHSKSESSGEKELTHVKQIVPLCPILIGRHLVSWSVDFWSHEWLKGCYWFPLLNVLCSLIPWHLP